MRPRPLPRLYVLFYAAYPAIEPDIRLPFWVCLVAERRRAVTSHLFLKNNLKV